MWLFPAKKKSIYLDYAAATPVRPEVLRAMEPFWAEHFGNPSSIHAVGMEAQKALRDAREKAARTLKIAEDGIIFTSGGTESNNLAIGGSVRFMLDAGVSPADIEIISTEIEHPSILKSLEKVKDLGVRVTTAPIGEDGRVLVEEFKKLLSPKTRLVSVAYVNSETGVIEDIGKLVRLVRAFEKENGLTILFHTDAAQAPLWLSCGMDALPVDLMSLDAGKCRGPKGVGLLAKRPRAKLLPVSAGGSQEGGLRAGTEPLPLIVGMSESLALAQTEQAHLASKVAPVRDHFISLLETIPGVVLNGSHEHRVANNVNISIPGIDTEFLVVALSGAAVFASTKSACSGSGGGLSGVVFSMTKERERSLATVRFSLSPDTTLKDVAHTTDLIKEHLQHSTLPL